MEATTASAGVIEARNQDFDSSMSGWIGIMEASTGVAAPAMMQMMAANRQMVNAMGGMETAIRTTEDAVWATRGLYGSLEDTYKANLGIMTEFGNKGIKPTHAALAVYNKDLFDLAKQTGMAGEAMNAMINSIADDDSSIQILRAARDDEREAILANQRALLKNTIAQGMTAKQAEEAAKMLNKMVAQKPLDRLKMAAKTKALGYAMGLGPEAEKAAMAIQHGKLATANERADAMAFGTAAANAYDKAASQGIGQELFVSELMEKLDFDQYFGANSPFSTTLGRTNQSVIDLKTGYQVSADSNLVKISIITDMVSQIATSMMDGTFLWAGMLSHLGDIRQLLGGAGDKIQAGAAATADTLNGWMNKLDAKLHPDHPYVRATDNAAKLAAKQAEPSKPTDAVALMVQQAQQQKQEITARISKEKEQKANEERLAKEHKEKTAEPTAAPTPASAQYVRPLTDPVKDSEDKSRSNRAEAVAQEHTNLLSAQTSNLDMQLVQLNKSTEYLKIMADAVPVMKDLAEKTLAATTMSEDQKGRFAQALKGKDTEFNAVYGYAG